MQTTTSTGLIKWIRILGNGTISIPKSMREKIGIKKGNVVKMTLIGTTIVIEPQKAPPQVQKGLSAGGAAAKADSLLSLVGSIPKGGGLPEDLSVNHDKYAWRSETLVIVGDADALIAIVHEEDIHHQNAVSLLHSLV